VVRDYELMYIIRPDLDDEALKAATESVGTMVRGLGGEVHKTAMWGKRRLAYEISHLRDGHYVVSQLSLEAARVSDLEKALTIHDTVFRHLLVRRAEPAEEPAATQAAEAGAGPGDGVRPEEDGTEAATAGEEDEVPAAESEEDEVPAAESEEDEG
jgi:small subunit ribosomal protein S6